MTWKIDPTHASLTFTGKHMKFAKVRGKFEQFDADVEIDENDLSQSSGTITVDVASIDSGFDQRDNHLRSADFFDVEQYPNITFETRRIEPRGENEYRIVGDLTIRDVTREVAFDGEVGGPLTDPWGGSRVVLSAATKVNRKDWGLEWNMPLGVDGFLVSDDIVLELDAEFQKAA
jgi:polyisoprenoid-binding protein YceI